MKNFIEDSAESIMLNSMANVFVAEKLDPVGKEDADIDNDGDSDSSDSYLRKRRKAIGAAIAADKAKRVKKEEVEFAMRQKVEGLTEKKLYKSEKATTSDEKETEITEKSVKNKVVINPDIAEGVLDAALKTDKKVGELHKKVDNDVKRMKAGKKFKEEVELEEGIRDRLKSAAKAVKKGVEQENKFQRASGETLDRMKRMTRHKQDKYGPSTLKQRLRTGADHNIDNEKKAKQVKEGATEVAMSNKETMLQKKKNKIDMMISRERNKELMKKEETINEKAVSRAQQKFMGMVRAAQKGEGASSPEVAKVAASMKKKDVKDFASTKHDKLPEKKSVKEEIIAMLESRREDAQKSLAKVKDRQKVLDAHEKKTGKKLDITKTPEHKDHKKNFPGAKRTGKKVKGAKETPSETHNRRVNRNVSRIVKHGYTSKEKEEVKGMAKHASRFD
jgi:hypothetical protein